MRSHFYQHGLYGGYSDFRYGSPKKKKAFKKRLLNDGKRRHVVGRIVDQLSKYRLSKFEFEGACRHGLRAALCLKGHSWARADHEAAMLVEEALRQIGAVRPSWDEGQREYSEPRENCAWCGVLVPEEILNTGKRHQNYCCTECARAALTHRRLVDSRRESSAYKDAFDILQRSEQSRKCELCGKSYRPLFGSGKFCSMECSSESQATRPTLKCEECGTSFTARLSHGKRARFCSPACKTAHGHDEQYEKQCLACGQTFRAKLQRAEFCSRSCNRWYFNNAHKGTLPKKMSAQLFDYLWGRNPNDCSEAA